jgi:hypothetical protein
MRFLIKEVTFVRPEDAKAAKKALATQRIGENAVRTAILNGGRVDAFDWKMAQRKQWAVFRGQPCTAALFARCRLAGTVLDVHEIEGDAFVLFSDIDSAQSVEDAEAPSLADFVEKLNADELEFDSPEFDGPGPSGEPRQMAIVVDELPQGIADADIAALCGEHASACVIKVVPSLKDARTLRAVLFPRSKSSTNTLYRALNEAQIAGERLKPVRMRREDVSEPPDVPDLPQVDRPARKPRQCIVVDPMPGDWTVEGVTEICAEFQPFTVTITGSAAVAGARRVIVEAGSARTKKHIFRIMNGCAEAARFSEEDLPPPIPT